MGSTMSPAQEELIRKHTDQNSQIIVMLDEDESGRAGREDVVVRLASIRLCEGPRFRARRQTTDSMTAEEVICEKRRERKGGNDRKKNTPSLVGLWGSGRATAVRLPRRPLGRRTTNLYQRFSGRSRPYPGSS